MNLSSHYILKLQYGGIHLTDLNKPPDGLYIVSAKCYKRLLLITCYRYRIHFDYLYGWLSTYN